MARSIVNIQQDIITQVQNTPALGILSTSTTAIWRLWTYIVASAIYLLEVMFDTHKIDVAAQIAAMKPHTTRWYQSKALAYQHGRSLVEGEDYYDNSSLTIAQIDAEKIVKWAAVTDFGQNLKMKVAKNNGGDPAPLTATELIAFKEYINDVKDAGVRIEFVSIVGDLIRLKLDVYYDAKVIDSNGYRIDGTDNESVQNAVKLYLKNLPYDGVLLLSGLVDALQKVDGVVSPVVRECKASISTNATAFFTVTSLWATYAGYFSDVNLTINFIEYDL